MSFVCLDPVLEQWSDDLWAVRRRISSYSTGLPRDRSQGIQFFQIYVEPVDVENECSEERLVFIRLTHIALIDGRMK